jgi:hypothetical protein
MVIALAALVAWVLTAGGGFFLLAIWIAKGAARQPRASHFPPALIFTHLTLAAAGLVLWIIYLFIDRDLLAWIAFILLALVAVLGFALLARWLPTYRARARVPSAGPGAATGGEQVPAEKHFPVAVVAGHGILAVITLVLVLITALGLSGS